MAELDPRDFLFLKKINETITLSSSEGIAVDDVFAMFTGYGYGRESAIMHEKVAVTLDKLLKKEVIDLSPDGARFKLTNYGQQLLLKKLREERDWINQGAFIKLTPEKKEEIDIKQGEYFKGYWEIVAILKRAKRIVRIQDAYIGTDTIAMLNELDDRIEICILTSDKEWKHKDLSLVSFSKFHKQRNGKTELKFNNKIHSRRVIIDDLEVYSCDDSLKDIGLHKASKIKRLENIEEELENYNIAWKEAAVLS